MATVEFLIGAALFVVAGAFGLSTRFRAGGLLAAATGTPGLIAARLLMKPGVEGFLPPNAELAAVPLAGVTWSADGRRDVPFVEVSFAAGTAMIEPKAMTQISVAVGEYRFANRLVRLRLVAPERADPELWLARNRAVRDELERMGMPAAYVLSEGDGPMTISLKPEPRIDAERVKVPIYSVAYVDVRVIRGAQTAVVVTATGTTNGIWRNFELRPAEPYSPESKTLAFSLVGTPPGFGEVDAPAFFPARASLRIEPLPRNVRTIRVGGVEETFRRQ